MGDHHHGGGFDMGGNQWGGTVDTHHHVEITY